MSEAFGERFFGLTAKHRLEAAATLAEQAESDLRQGNLGISSSLDQALTAIDQVRGLRAVRDRYAALGLPAIAESYFITPVEPAPAQLATVTEPPQVVVDTPIPVEPVAPPQPARMTVLPPTGPRERRPIAPVEPQRPVAAPPIATTFGEPSLVGPAVIQETQKALAAPGTLEITFPAPRPKTEPVIIRLNRESPRRDGRVTIEPTWDEIEEWRLEQLALRGGNAAEYSARVAGRDVGPWKLMNDPLGAILFQDDDLMVINKPSAVNTHHGDLARIGSEEVYRYHFGDAIGAAHRIDGGASGVLIMARNQRSLDALRGQFARKQEDMVKVHIALLDGVFKHRGVRTTSLEVVPDLEAEDNTMKVVERRIPGVSRSTLSYFLPLMILRDKDGADLTLTQVQIVTGRPHQIRASSEHLGVPIVGDNLYNKQVQGTVRSNDRLMLHHLYVAFDHPITGERLQIVAPPPTDFRRVYDRMIPVDTAEARAMLTHNWGLSFFGHMPELAEQLKR